MGLFRWFARRAAGQAFRLCDSSGDGKLQLAEVEVAVLKMYNMINKRLPSWQDPPSSSKIRAAFELFDVDKTGSLDVDQFFDFASTMVNTGPDAFFARIGRSALVNTMVLPGASYGLKRFAGPLLGLDQVPHVVLSPIIGIVTKAARALTPW